MASLVFFVDLQLLSLFLLNKEVQDDIKLNISTVTIHDTGIVTKSLSVSTKAAKNEWEWVAADSIQRDV